jgi:hypothetical protein
MDQTRCPTVKRRAIQSGDQTVTARRLRGKARPQTRRHHDPSIGPDSFSDNDSGVSPSRARVEAGPVSLLFCAIDREPSPGKRCRVHLIGTANWGPLPRTGVKPAAFGQQPLLSKIQYFF